MGLFDDLQEAAKKATPALKDFVSEASRTAKAVGETIREEQPVKKTAAGAGKAIKSVSNTVIEKNKEHRIEKETDRFAELKVKYPGGGILYIKPYHSFQAKTFRELGVELDHFEEMTTAHIVFDESKRPVYRIVGNYSGRKRIFTIRNWSGQRIATVVEHDRIIRKTHESLYIGRTHIIDIDEDYIVNDPRFTFEGNPKSIRRKPALLFEGRPYMELSSVRGFELMAFADRSQEIEAILFYTAIQLLARPVIHSEGG